MKIAFVVHDFLEGVGHGRYCIELAREFSPLHEIHVIANRFEPNLDFPVRQHHVSAWRATALTSVLTFAGTAENILRREQFDIVHAQGFSCRRADVVTAHVCNAARYRRSPVQRWKERFFPALVIPRERQFYQNSGAAEIIAVSNVVKRELEVEYGVKNVSVVHHGVDATEFSPANEMERSEIRRNLNLPADAWIWMFAGEAAKGLRETIRALAEFPDARLLVITRSALSEWERLASKAGVANRVHFHGPTAELARFYRVADIFVYPSAYDAFGLVVAEAMACGLPVVIGGEIGAAEWIDDGKNGFRCDPKEVATALRNLKNLSGAQLQALRETARQTAEAHTWKKCAEETWRVYERAMASKRSSR